MGFSIWNRHKWLSQLFPIHLNMLRVYDHYPLLNSSELGPSLDVRIWRLQTSDFDV